MISNVELSLHILELKSWGFEVLTNNVEVMGLVGLNYPVLNHTFILMNHLPNHSIEFTLCNHTTSMITIYKRGKSTPIYCNLLSSSLDLALYINQFDKFIEEFYRIESNLEGAFSVEEYEELLKILYNNLINN